MSCDNKGLQQVAFFITINLSSLNKRDLSHEDTKPENCIWHFIIFIIAGGHCSCDYTYSREWNNLAAATINRAYTSATFTAGGCTGGTYNWTATGLPAGLNLNNTTGTTDYIRGTPTASGSFTISVTVTHTGCAPNSVTNTYYLTVNPALALTPVTIIPAVIGPNAIS